MVDNDAIDYSTPPGPGPFRWWGIVILPIIIAAGPVVLAFLGFSAGYSGMPIAAFALLSGYFLSPAAAVLSTINCIVFRRNPWAVAISLSAIFVAAGAFCYEIWRMNGEWD